MSKKGLTQPLERCLPGTSTKEGLMALDKKERLLVAKILKRAIKREKM